MIFDGRVRVRGEGVDVVVDYRRDPSLTVVKSGVGLWSDAAMDGAVLQDIEDLGAAINAASGGVVATEVTMQPDVWPVFWSRITDKQKEELLSWARTGGSEVQVGPASSEKVQYRGRLGAFNFYTYRDDFIDVDGSTQEIVPAGAVALANPAALRCRLHYGVILDRKANFQAMDRFSKVYEEEDPSMEWLLTQSAPLVGPFNPNASGSLRVL